jgi:glutamine synthetase
MTAPPIPASPDGFARWCETAGIHTVIAGAADTHGIWRGKRLPLADFLVKARPGIPVSDAVLVLTHAEPAVGQEELVEPPGGSAYPGYFPRKEQGFPDIFLRPDLGTARCLPWHPGTVAVLGEFRLPDGGEVPIGPRAVLRRVIERARSLGYEPKIGLEYGFYLLRGDLAALRASGWRPEPVRERPQAYSVYGGSLDEGVLGEIRQQLAAAGVPVEACRPGAGPGQFQLALRYDDALKSADDGFVAKHAVKEIAARHGLMACFMAKPHRDWPGSACHIHQSLWSSDYGSSAFCGQAASDVLTETGRQYAGGLLATMRECAALLAPTPNSYKRLTPYSSAATTVSWGYGNRSTGIRAIAGGAGGARIEHRLPGADVNPYLAIAACLAGGLHGIEKEIAPDEAFAGDAYAAIRFDTVPQSLAEAVGLLERGSVAREMLGDDFVGHYAHMKRHEADKYREQVTEWEIRRYAEMALPAARLAMLTRRRCPAELAGLT